MNQRHGLRVDWFRLLNDLKREGYSHYAIAHFTKIPKSTLDGYKAGAEPRHCDGQTLIDCWAQVTGQHELPMISPYSHTA